MTAENLITLLRGNQLPQFDFKDIMRVADEIIIDLVRREGEPYVCRRPLRRASRLEPDCADNRGKENREPD